MTGLNKKENTALVTALKLFIAPLIIGCVFLTMGIMTNSWKSTLIGCLIIILGIIGSIAAYIGHPETRKGKMIKNTNMLAACILVGMTAIASFTGTIATTAAAETPTINGTVHKVTKPRQGKDIYTALMDVPQGQIFELEISVTGSMDLYCWTFSLQWDPNIISLYAVYEGPFLNGAYETIPVYAEHTLGYLRGLTNVRKGDVPGKTGDGVICWINFVANNPGTTLIYIISPKWVDSTTLTKHNFPPIDPVSVHVTGGISVGGVRISINKLELLAPYIELGLASVISIAVGVIYFKRRREKH